MSLTICRECGKAISVKADVCPNCGGPVTKYPPLDEYIYILTNFEKYDSLEKEHLEERINELLEFEEVRKYEESILADEEKRKEEEDIKRQKLSEEKEAKVSVRTKYLLIGFSAFLVILVILAKTVNHRNQADQAEADSIASAIDDSTAIADSTAAAQNMAEFYKGVEKNKEIIKSSVRITSAYTSSPNSAGGVDVNLYYRNLSSKTIKYFIFKAIPINAVGDPVECSVKHGFEASGRDTGPVKPGRSGGGCWRCMWYNYSIRKMQITEVEIEYMDGTSLDIKGDDINLIR